MNPIPFPMDEVESAVRRRNEQAERAALDRWAVRNKRDLLKSLLPKGRKKK